MKSVTKAKFHNNYISISTSFENKNRIKTQKELDNLEKGKNGDYNGYMSKTTAKKCKQILQCFMTSTKEKAIKHKKENLKGKKPLTTFITLTLSSKQKHDDNFIKRNLLGQFIVSMKNHCNMKSYFWRAEPQKNGNIHFHIVTDIFIRHEFIRSEWNNIQERFGYLEDFTKKFGHKNPNSTDIHALKSINNAISYVCKYCCKTGNPDSERKINGRIWGCSDNIRDLKIYECILQENENNLLVSEDAEKIEMLRELEKEKKKVKVIYTDFGKILCSRFEILSIIKNVNDKIAKEMCEYYLNMIY
jgi:hypothetical protein